MSRIVTLAGYLVIVAVAVALEVGSRRRRRGATFGDALAVVLRPGPARFALVAAWLWLGWHLFVRVDWG
jgi:Family of unknown function (DUF6186)